MIENNFVPSLFDGHAVSMEDGKMEELKDAYTHVKNHIYRHEKAGSLVDYGDAVIKLGEAFQDYMSVIHFKNNIPEGFWHVIHDFISVGYHFRCYGQAIMMGRRSKEYYSTKVSHDMRIVEKYLHQVHAYMDTGIFVKFDVYYPGSNPYPGWCHYKYVKERHAMILESHDRDEEVIEHCPKCKTGYFANRSGHYEDKKWTRYFKCDNCGHEETRYGD